MITEDITLEVAEAQVSDLCQVELWVGDLRRHRTAALTPTQARALAAELIRAAGEAERAAEELRHEHEPAAFDYGVLINPLTIEGSFIIPERYVHPECVAGKCGNCDGETMAADDSMVPCEHHCHGKAAA